MLENNCLISKNWICNARWKRTRVWLIPMTKRYTHRQIQKATRQHNTATKIFDYTTIADRLMVVSWRNEYHMTGMVLKLKNDVKMLENIYNWYEKFEAIFLH